MKEMVVKLPRNEVAQVEILNPKTRATEYIITQNSRTEKFSIFEISKNVATKLASASSPIDLENKYIKRKVKND